MVAVTSPAGRRVRTAWRWLILLVVGIYLLLPMVAMLDFSTRGAPGTRSLESWTSIPSSPGLMEGLFYSLELAVLSVLGTMVLLLPTMVWVHLRVPRLRRTLEVVCLLPLTIPAIVLVVGIAPIYVWVTYFLGGSPLTLTFVYMVLVLPFAHRAVDASLRSVDVVTMSEASRTLGASWMRTLVGVIIPNIRVGIMSAAVISIALVLGEFTIASLLHFDTLQPVITLIGKRDAGVSVAVSLAALIFAFLLLIALPTSDGMRAAGETVD